MEVSLLHFLDRMAHSLATNPGVVAFVLSMLGGIILGVGFFAALYITARRAPFTLRPGMWFSLSFVLRFGVLVTGLYVAARSGITPLLGCALGILLGRFGFQRVVLAIQHR
ncbi:MAG: ATP synthase subunit I [Thermodesulfobacteriota bacterium]